MHLHFEEPSSRMRCDSVINSLSWMGRVPDEQPEGHGWKLNRTSYYQEGWLAAGNVKSVVGVTFTSTLPNRSSPTAAWSSSSSNGASGAAPPVVSTAGAFQLPLPPRTNYNLRGHRAQISLVRWNEPYQKLATCDASGIIFVWIRYEGRWSIELINDRNRPVTHFSWSHDGRMAVIAYQDGFVLVGSVAGQRYWSTFLNQDYVITTGTWTPDDQQVYLGTSNGMVVVLDVRNGDVISEIQMTEPIPPAAAAGSSSVRSNGSPASSTSPSWSPSSTPPLSAASSSSSAAAANGCPLPNGIRQLAWNCPRFKMEEPANAPAPGAASNGSGPNASGASTTDPSVPPLLAAASEEQHVLAVLTFGGRLSLIKGFDDVHPCYAGVGDDEAGCDADDADQYRGLLLSPMMEWNNDGELLCLAGHYCPSSGASSNGAASGISTPAAHYVNVLQFYNSRGVLRFRINVPYTQAPITSITWGHNDRRLFVATGCTVHVAWVSPRRMASLQHLARLRLRQCLKSADQLDRIADRLPKLMRSLVSTLFNSTIHCHVPEEHRIREFVCRPPPANTRLYCTMIRREDESASADIDSGGIDPNAAASSGGSGVAFTLYLEFLGGLIPLLKGKPTSRLRPEFVILDPQQPATGEPKGQHQSEHQHGEADKSPETLLTPPPTTTTTSGGSTTASKLTQLLSPALQRKFRRSPRPPANSSVTIGGDSDSETEESCVSTPRLQRKFGAARKHHHQAANHNAPPDAAAALSTDAKHQGETALAEIASNIWGTRFKITGFPPTLPSHLGQVTYKTSLLHLQPRQMTLGVVDLRDPQPGDVSSSEDNSTAFSPSDDEETCSTSIKETETTHLASVAPLATPNLRLRRKTPRRMEPPPAPTHHRRPVDPNQVLDEMVRMELSDSTPERVVLSTPVVRWRSLSVGHIVHRESSTSRSHKRRKSRSLDSSPVIRPYVHQKLPVLPASSAVKRDHKKTSASFRIGSQVQQSVQQSDGGAREKHRFALARLSPLFGRKCPSSKSPLTEPSTPNSSPAVNRRRNNQTATKTDRRQSPIRQLLNSPLLARRLGRGRFSSTPQVVSDSSDDDDTETTTAYNYHDLESFQKAQLLNKLKQTWLAEKNAAVSAPVIKEVPLPKKRREFVLNNKAPLWNEHSQVYQLDFGGRVTQESAKNFQIEFKGKQVMQFGRIDGNAYTLDFQYPFSAVQAFAVALANVTQRLK